MKLTSLIQSASTLEVEDELSSLGKRVIDILEPLRYAVKYDRSKVIHLLSEKDHRELTQYEFDRLIENSSRSCRIALIEAFPDLSTVSLTVQEACRGYKSKTTHEVEVIITKTDCDITREMVLDAAECNFLTFLTLMKNSNYDLVPLFEELSSRDIETSSFEFLLNETREVADFPETIILNLLSYSERRALIVLDTVSVNMTEPVRLLSSLVRKDNSFFFEKLLRKDIHVKESTLKSLVGECIDHLAYGCLRILLRGKDTSVNEEDFVKALEKKDPQLILLITETNAVDFSVAVNLADTHELYQSIHSQYAGEVDRLEELEESPFKSSLVTAQYLSEGKDLRKLSDSVIDIHQAVETEEIYESLRDGAKKVKPSLGGYLAALKFYREWCNQRQIEQSLYCLSMKRYMADDLKYLRSILK